MPMSRVFISTVFLAFAAVAWMPASAQQKMRPGLWEHSMSMKSQSGQMEAALGAAQRALASMPPAQRKQLEQMLAEQGLGLGSGAQDQTVEVCITPEQADLDHIPQQDGCTQKVQRVGASTIQVSFSCQGGQGQPATRGEGTVSFQSPTSYVGDFKIQTSINGKPEQIDMEHTGRWLSSECGAIRPVPLGR